MEKVFTLKQGPGIYCLLSVSYHFSILHVNSKHYWENWPQIACKFKMRTDSLSAPNYPMKKQTPFIWWCIKDKNKTE